MSVYRYLALGDSYTIGESVSAQERWPHLLVKLLEARGIQVEMQLIARTGWTVNELWEAIRSGPPAGAFDLVTLLIGVNDQYRGYPENGYRQDFRFLLGKAIEFAGGHPRKVIVLSIPDWGVTPFAADRDRVRIAHEIDAFNAINRRETKQAGAHYVDVTPASRLANQDAALIASDGLHPSGAMYAVWAQDVLPVALEILR